MAHPDPILVERLRDAISHSPWVECALLFGSRATGTARADSDVDIAVVPARDPGTLDEELALQARLERAVGASVDLVRLDTATTLLRWQVARDGVLVWARDPRAESRFRAEAAIEWDEFRDRFEDGLRRYAAAVIASGGAT